MFIEGEKSNVNITVEVFILETWPILALIYNLGELGEKLSSSDFSSRDTKTS